MKHLQSIKALAACACQLLCLQSFWKARISSC